MQIRRGEAKERALRRERGVVLSGAHMGSRVADVSVVIATFNRPKVLLEAVGSALGQVGVNVEVIVLDDAPSGSARSAIESVNDPRVRYVHRPIPSNGRPGMVRNEGAKLAHGHYLHFLDDDDTLERDSLLVLSNALQARPGAGVAFGRIVPFGENETVLARERRHFEHVAETARTLKGRFHLTARLVFRGSLFVNSAAMTTREVFLASGGYDDEISVCEDAELWARIARRTDYVFLDRPVLNYRTGAPSLMTDLVENDPKLLFTYARMQQKYRRTHGALEFYALKLLSRVP
jgi:glycosyltransferase involved in cell wall biosynthesis